MYMYYLLRRLSLQDLYPDMLIQYLIILIRSNVKSLNKLFT